MRILQTDHDQMFEVFAGDETQAVEAHRNFTNWLASTDLSEAAKAEPGESTQAQQPTKSSAR
jgi:hypothetical protein